MDDTLSVQLRTIQGNFFQRQIVLYNEYIVALLLSRLTEFCLTFVSGIHKLKMSLPARNPKSVRAQPFDPIPPVAEKISSQWWLLCFDEFQVICSNKISTMSGHTQKHIFLALYNYHVDEMTNKR